MSRKRLDFHALDEGGEPVAIGAVPPDRDGLTDLVDRLFIHDRVVYAAIESMNGARFVHDQLELASVEVEICDAQRVKGLAPLACKTDRIDAWVLAELARRDLMPAIWLPTPEVRAERERARFRLHLVRQRTRLKNRIHHTLIALEIACPVSDLFGTAGRELLARLALPEAWQRTLQASLRLIDELDREITSCERGLRRLGADHRYVPRLMTCPGIAWVLAYTIASELGSIDGFPTTRKLTGYTGLCPKVDQSGERDWRGPLKKNGPRYLRWALIEAAQHAGRSPHYQPLYRRKRAQYPGPRGSKVAAICVACQLAEAIWYMLSRDHPSLRQAPRRLWPHDGPRMRCATGANSNQTSSPTKAQWRDEHDSPDPERTTATAPQTQADSSTTGPSSWRAAARTPTKHPAPHQRGRYWSGPPLSHATRSTTAVDATGPLHIGTSTRSPCKAPDFIGSRDHVRAGRMTPNN